MAKFVDYDPQRGLATYEDMDSSNKLQIHYRQDVEPLLDYTRTLRNEGATDKGIKNDLWHYAQIPQVVILEMRFKHGVDIFNKNHTKRVFELINREYPHLKTTEKMHWVKN